MTRAALARLADLEAALARAEAERDAARASAWAEAREALDLADELIKTAYGENLPSSSSDEARYWALRRALRPTPETPAPTKP